MATDPVRRRVVIRGRVQGVWFRNRPDGAVEAVLEGPSHSVDELVRFCHTGPPHARVESVEAMEEEAAGETGFRVC